MSKSQASKNKAFRISGRSVGHSNTQNNTKKLVPDATIKASFENTSVLHNNLRKKRQNRQGEVISRRTGKQLIKELMETHQDFRDGFQSEQEKLNKLKEEVKALPEILRPNPNPRTYKMLLDQKVMRRQQHLEELREFESETVRVRQSGSEKTDSLKKEIDTYLKDNVTSIDDYFRALDDQKLLSMEDEIVGQITGMKTRKVDQLDLKLTNVNEQLDQFEEEFLKDIEGAVEGLRFTLVDIAFKLEPEVNQIVDGIKETFKQDIEDGKAKNKEYFDKLAEKVQGIKQDVIRRSEEKIAHWRVLKHQAVIENHIKEINKADYQEPVDRKLLIAEIDAYMDITMEKRTTKLKEIYMTPAVELSPEKVQKFLDGLAALDEQVQDALDQYVNRLMGLKDECLARIEALIDHSKSRLKHYSADLSVACPATPTYDELFDYLFQEEHEKLKTYHTKILEQLVNFIESRDKASNSLGIQVGRTLKQFAVRLTKFINDQAEAKNQYELEKAKLEDDSNERLENYAKELDESKAKLRRSKDHGELDIRLKACFDMVDTIEVEFRAFHDENRKVISKHLPFIENVFAVLTSDILNLLALVDESKREELEQLYDKVAKWKAKIKTDDFLKERDEREQRELEEQIEKNKDNKKWKPPKPKAVDAKKAAAEWTDLFNKFYAELKRPVVEVTVKEVNATRLEQKSLKAYCISLFQPVKPELTEEEKAKLEEERLLKEKEEHERKLKEEEEAKKKKGAKPAKAQTEEVAYEPAEDPEDFVVPKMQYEMPLYADHVPLFTSEYLIQLDFIIELEQKFRGEVFDYIQKLKNLRVSEAESEDQAFLETSLALLDERLKHYYSMKGRIQTEIYSIRGGEISLHKKKYEQEVKACLDEVDMQTSEFNKIYKTLFDGKEGHTNSLLALLQTLSQQTSLAAIQGVLNSAKDRDFKWGEQSSSLVASMRHLSSTALDALIKANANRISNKRLIEDKGEYSEEEVAWYQSMMNEINSKIEGHRTKRAEITDNIEQLTKTRKEEILKKFSEAYDVALDELAARNSTGKVFGKPRRLAQEIVRSEISYCIRADQTLNDMIERMKDLLGKYQAGTLSSKEVERLWADLRFRFMSFRNSAFYLGRYLAAFTDKSPLEDMPRVTYVEDCLDIKLKETEKKEDDERKVKELERLDQIYYRGEKIRFMDRIKDMETAVSQETAKLYVQQYARFLGPDKTTDFLRVFVQGLRKEMEDFRIDAIRQLRTVTQMFCEVSITANKVLFGSIKDRFNRDVNNCVSAVQGNWSNAYTESEQQKADNLKKLRPNMTHPFNKPQREQLFTEEANRMKRIFAESESKTISTQDCYFTNCNMYLQKTLNSFYFLCLFYDNCILQEDYIKLPGDEEEVKEHLSLKKLMIMQQKGELKDTSSLRSITKRWKSYPVDMFAVHGKTYEFKDVN